MSVERFSLAEVLELAFPASLRRVFATLVVLSAASFVVNQSTSAAFTATVRSPNNTFSTGSLELTTSASGSGLFTVSGLVPGDIVVATIDLRNAGTIDASTYTMTTTADTPSVLTDASMGRMLPAGTADYLRIAVSLPEAAGNTLGNQSAVVTFRWDAGQ